jgi:hypothetical protein
MVQPLATAMPVLHASSIEAAAFDASNFSTSASAAP